jgi:hypothetical protein
VVDLSAEADDRWLEGIFVREVDFELEVTTLCNVSGHSSMALAYTHSVDGLIWAVHKDLPLGHVLLIEVDFHA